MKLKDLPRTLLVKDQEYTIKYVRAIPSCPGWADDAVEGLAGACDYSTQTIYVRLGQKPRERLSTLLHELIHAADDEWHISLTHAQIYKLEEALLRILTDNSLIG